MKHLTIILLFISLSANSQDLKVTYVGLNILDTYTTVRGLEQGGRELNPLMTDQRRMVFLKGSITMANMYLISEMEKTHPKAAKITLIGINVIYIGVIINNIIINHENRF